MLFAREGARVMLVDYNLEAAEETKRLIEAEGGTCFTSQADVSSALDCNRIAQECVGEYGGIDILHNNVGIEIPGGILEITEDDWDRTIDVNLKSVFLMCRAVVPQMIDQGGGSIVNISSINGIRTLPALSGPYGASKLGMVALTREIAIEFASQGIRCNAILPGMMRTPFVEASLTQAWGGDVEEMMKSRDAMIPIGKQGESWDVAHAALLPRLRRCQVRHWRELGGRRRSSPAACGRRPSLNSTMYDKLSARIAPVAEDLCTN